MGIQVGGNWTNDGTFTARAGTVTFNGGLALQTIGGIAAKITFNNLALDNSAGGLRQVFHWILLILLLFRRDIYYRCKRCNTLSTSSSNTAHIGNSAGSISGSTGSRKDIFRGAGRIGMIFLLRLATTISAIGITNFIWAWEMPARTAWQEDGSRYIILMNPRRPGFNNKLRTGAFSCKRIWTFGWLLPPRDSIQLLWPVSDLQVLGRNLLLLVLTPAIGLWSGILMLQELTGAAYMPALQGFQTSFCLWWDTERLCCMGWSITAQQYRTALLVPVELFVPRRILGSEFRSRRFIDIPGVNKTVTQ